MRLLLFLPLALLACRGEVTIADDDEDGYDANHDCNDADAAVHPGATEACDGIDNDCDNQIDEDAGDTGATFYVDVDGDGYGDSARTTVACAAPPGHVEVGGDCDDNEAAVHPGASEADCSDPTDYNCDGSTGFSDGDGDDYPACEDCDDASAANHPGAVELCDEVDNDCDGSVDEAGAVGTTTWYADGDGDGYGDPKKSSQACSAPSGYVENANDCNDASAAALPGGTESCDGLDNDCDGKVDDDASDAATWYVDTDGDGFGSSVISQKACEAPAGFADKSGDCDDTKKSAYPGGSESCDGADNDCNGTIDDGFDKDGDGVTTCAGDCDDTKDAVRPGATETCDAIDNDCDGQTDEAGATGAATWYIDYDGDGYGSTKYKVQACEGPDGYADNSDDCDDLDEAYNPGADLGCDGEDYDCDGEIDNDGDGDGYASQDCGGDDCDDTKKDVYPEVGKGCALGTSCLDLLTRKVATKDGAYVVDPDGPKKGVDPFETWCDMTTDSGGWTLVEMVSSTFQLNSTYWNEAGISPTLLGQYGSKPNQTSRLHGDQINALCRSGKGEVRSRYGNNGPSLYVTDVFDKTILGSLDIAYALRGDATYHMGFRGFGNGSVTVTSAGPWKRYNGPLADARACSSIHSYCGGSGVPYQGWGPLCDTYSCDAPGQARTISGHFWWAGSNSGGGIPSASSYGSYQHFGSRWCR